MADTHALSTAVTSGAPQADAALSVESGRHGRLLVARLRPNEDLIEGLEALCRQHGVRRAVLRGALGSLIDATLAGADGRLSTVDGPGVEVLSLNGEIVGEAAHGTPSQLYGMVAGTDGRVHAGHLVRGANLAFITIEASLQEWLPQA